MSKFHRFVDPTYYLFPGETFPNTAGGTGVIGGITYDRANVESGGSSGGPSGPSNADAQRATGTNQFTYFVAFGESATSLRVNRGFRAAFESLDAVDDVLRTSVAVRATQSGTSAASLIAVTGWVYVGTSTSEQAADLVSLSDSGGVRPRNGTTLVSVQDIQDGGGLSVIGQTWVENPTIALNTVYTGAYTLQYGTRGSFARTTEQAPGAFWSNWAENSAAIANINQLFSFGIDEKYRHATGPTSASPSTLDTPGAGAVFTRDGPAITGIVPLTNFAATYANPDALGSVFSGRYTDYTVDQTQPGANYGGQIPFTFLDGRQHSNTSATVFNSSGASLAALAANLVPMDVTTEGVSFGDVVTSIPKDAPAVISGTNGDVVELTGSSYFAQEVTAGTLSTNIKLRVDFLVITNSSGEKNTFIMYDLPGTLGTPTAGKSVTIRVLNQTGSSQTGLSAGDVVTVQWVAVRAAFGGSYNTLPMLGLYADSPLRTSGDVTPGPRVELVAQPSSAPATVIFEVQEPEITPLQPSGRRPVLSLSTSGGITSDFGPDARNTGEIAGALRHRPGLNTFNDQNQSYTIDPLNPGALPSTTGPGLSHFVGGCVGGPGITPTVTFDVTGSVGNGTELRWTWEFTAGCEATFVWGLVGGTSFRFSSPEDAQPGAIQVTGGFVVWTGLVSGSNIFMTRTDYPN